MVGTDPAEVERQLRAGLLVCPCGVGRLHPWGHARPRTVRDVGPLRPRRSRCSACAATHVLVAASCLVRRADAVEVIGSVVIRVRHLAAQVESWSNVLDYAVREPIGEDFALLHPRAGRGPNVSLDAHHSDRVLPPRIHLDLYAQDQQREVARLRELGAQDVQWARRPTDADYVIMEDTEGNRFCVIDAAEWSGWAVAGAGAMAH